MVFNATFNNISFISWWSALLEKTRVPDENHRPAASHWQTLSHNVVSSTPHLSGIRTHNVSDDTICGILFICYTILGHVNEMCINRKNIFIGSFEDETK